jgi:hypothetical protein
MTDDPLAAVRQIQALAHVADGAAAAIFQHLLAQPQDGDADRWRKAMRDLDAAAARLDYEAMVLMAQVDEKALAALQEATQQAEDFLQGSQDLQQRLKVFAAVLGLAGALTDEGGAAAVVKAAWALKVAAGAPS